MIASSQNQMLRPCALRSLTKSLQQPLITIIGATGTGKSQLAVDLALRFDGEIINGDAMQMYEGLDIITNKMSVVERKGVNHHLLGVLEKDRDGVWEKEVRVGVFERKALEAIEDIRARGKLPILVGGTHYYIQALLFPGSILDSGGSLNDSSPTSSTMARDNRLLHENQVDKIGREELGKKHPILNAPTSEILAELQKVDPVMAARWHPNDHRKIKRSLEIYYLNNGTPASEVYARQQQESSTYLISTTSQSRFRNLIFWVHSETEELNERLKNRIDTMIDHGMFEEIRELYSVYKMLNDRGEVVDLQRGVWQSIGFKEFLNYLPYLEAEEKVAAHACETAEGIISKEDLEKMKEGCIWRMVNATTRYAKQQVKWIRIKFMHALKAANTANDIHKLYLLDSTHILSYDEKVVQPAKSITEIFLAAGDGNERQQCDSYSLHIDSLPDPLSLSALAAEMLKPKRDYDLAMRPDLWVRNYCELCVVTTTDMEGWERHVSSGRHKKNIRRKKKREEGLMWKERRMRDELEKSGISRDWGERKITGVEGKESVECGESVESVESKQSEQNAENAESGKSRYRVVR